MDEKELKRILKNFQKIEYKFNLIDEQVEKSLRVSQKTLEKRINL